MDTQGKPVLSADFYFEENFSLGMDLSSRVANFIPQDIADDSKKADKQQRMIVREGLSACSTEKPGKEERSK